MNAQPAPPAPLTSAPHAQTTLRALRSGGPRTLSELAEQTGLSRPTLSAAAEELERRGWIVELQPKESAGQMGRPARRYRFKEDVALIAGVDVGLHKVLTFVADLNGRILAERLVETPASLSSIERLETVASAIRETASFLPSSAIAAITVGAPGVVDKQGRILQCPPLPEWDGIDLGRLLRERFACQVLVENDVMAAAWGEYQHGVARGADDVVYVLAGHRISSASIVGGRLHRGHSGAAGMVGELTELRWSTASHRLLSALGSRGISSIQDAFEAAEQGDTEAMSGIELYLDDLAVGITATALAIDPELIVIGGGVSMAGGRIAGELRKRVTERSHLLRPRVEISQLAGRATAQGALALSLDYVERNLLFP